jgi:hypothetical protein
LLFKFKIRLGIYINHLYLKMLFNPLNILKFEEASLVKFYYYKLLSLNSSLHYYKYLNYLIIIIKRTMFHIYAINQ